MTTRRLSEDIKAQMTNPSPDFDTKVSSLYYHTLAKYEKTSESVHLPTVRRVVEKLQNFLVLLMIFPIDIRERLITLSYPEIRITGLCKFLNLLTRLFALQDCDIVTVVDKFTFPLGQDFTYFWRAVAKSHANSQPILLEKLIYDGIIITNGIELNISEYGSFMLCICYYRLLTIEKTLRSDIQRLLRRLVVPTEMASYLQSFFSNLRLPELTDENLPENVYSLCGNPGLMHALNYRFGILRISNVLNTWSTPTVTVHVTSSCNQLTPQHLPDSRCPSMTNLSEAAAITGLSNKDSLITSFEPPHRYRDVKSFVYKYGNRIVEGCDSFAEQLLQRIERYNQNAPLTQEHRYVHNIMGIYTRIIGIIRQSNTVRPIEGTIMEVTPFTEYRTEIHISYSNDDKICSKLKLRKAVGLYLKGGKKPSVLAIIHSKGGETLQKKRTPLQLLSRKIVVRCMLPLNITLQPTDIIGMTESIDIEDELYEASSIYRRLNHRIPKLRF